MDSCASFLGYLLPTVNDVPPIAFHQQVTPSPLHPYGAGRLPLHPGDDPHASREYRRHVARALTRRALARALDRASPVVSLPVTAA